MAYKQKSEDLKNISRSMRVKSNYGPGPGDEDTKTEVKKGDKDVAKEIMKTPNDPTAGMDKMEKMYYFKSIGKLPSKEVGGREYPYDYEKGEYSNIGRVKP
tara:strand:+ start:151 stop:453 length:303 start_codon:yes stop_codon:yes gene_type:complete